MRSLVVVLATLTLAAALAPLPRTDAGGPTVLVAYGSDAALAAALRAAPATVLRRLPALGTVEVRPRGSSRSFVRTVSRLAGIRYAELASPRRGSAIDPALSPAAQAAGAYEWQWAAAGANGVPDDVRRAAAAITIAVIDTGVDPRAPDLAGKLAGGYDVASGGTGSADRNGHGTFVASLAAGRAGDGEGVAGFGGDARVLVVRAAAADGSFDDAAEAAAIVWAVDNGARILNLSFGGPDASRTEREAIEHAVGKGVLVVAAAGNGAPQYPAALLQPASSRGRDGLGLSVGASDAAGRRARFSATGAVSLVAPGDVVLGAVPGNAARDEFRRVRIPGSRLGVYALGSGTSFAAPQVAGAAALVWAANPALCAQDVALLLEQTASGGGRWDPGVGYGVLNVAAAVAAARGG